VPQGFELIRVLDLEISRDGLQGIVSNADHTLEVLVDQTNYVTKGTNSRQVKIKRPTSTIFGCVL
jgi:hypothetical protein